MAGRLPQLPHHSSPEEMQVGLLDGTGWNRLEQVGKFELGSVRLKDVKGNGYRGFNMDS